MCCGRAAGREPGPAGPGAASSHPASSERRDEAAADCGYDDRAEKGLLDKPYSAADCGYDDRADKGLLDKPYWPVVLNS